MIIIIKCCPPAPPAVSDVKLQQHYQRFMAVDVFKLLAVAGNKDGIINRNVHIQDHFGNWSEK